MRIPSQRQVVYLSESRLSGDPHRIALDLQVILDASIKNNERSGVTGVILFSGNHFAQCLEGPHFAVTQTLERILRDVRHDSIVMLRDVEIEQRSFETRAMALCTVLGKGDIRLGKIHASIDDLPLVGSAECIVNAMMEALSDQGSLKHGQLRKLA